MEGSAVAHVRVSCDKSGATPITGVRFKLLNKNYDLCAAEFEKLSPAEKQDYVAVKVPQSIDTVPARLSNEPLASLTRGVTRQDTDGVAANPALKLAQDNYFSILGSLTLENRTAFMKWCQEGVELPLEDGSLASLKPITSGADCPGEPAGTLPPDSEQYAFE